MEAASRYLPATRSGVGGDWFDVIPLSCGRVAFVIGDVMGRGLRAAAVVFCQALPVPGFHKRLHWLRSCYTAR